MGRVNGRPEYRVKVYHDGSITIGDPSFDTSRRAQYHELAKRAYDCRDWWCNETGRCIHVRLRVSPHQYSMRPTWTYFGVGYFTDQGNHGGDRRSIVVSSVKSINQVRPGNAKADHCDAR